MDADYDVSVRSVQRSLERLSSLFPISSELRGRANHWYWSDRHALTQIPSMSAPTAFALRLAADYLNRLCRRRPCRCWGRIFNMRIGCLVARPWEAGKTRRRLLGRGRFLRLRYPDRCAGCRLHGAGGESEGRGGLSCQSPDALEKYRVESAWHRPARRHCVLGRDVLAVRRHSAIRAASDEQASIA